MPLNCQKAVLDFFQSCWQSIAGFGNALLSLLKLLNHGRKPLVRVKDRGPSFGPAQSQNIYGLRFVDDDCHDSCQNDRRGTTDYDNLTEVVVGLDLARKDFAGRLDRTAIEDCAEEDSCFVCCMAVNMRLGQIARDTEGAVQATLLDPGCKGKPNAGSRGGKM